MLRDFERFSGVPTCGSKFLYFSLPPPEPVRVPNRSWGAAATLLTFALLIREELCRKHPSRDVIFFGQSLPNKCPK